MVGSGVAWLAERWPTLWRLFRFGLVGLSGLAVNTGVLALLTDLVGLHYLLGVVMATQASTTWNFVLTDRWVFDDREAKGTAISRFTKFWAVNNSALLLRVPIIVALTSGFGVRYLISSLATLIGLMLVRFGAADAWIWRATRDRLVPARVGIRDRLAGISLTREATRGTEATEHGAHERPPAGRHREGDGHLPGLWYLVALGLVLAVGGVLRVAGLDEFGFNSDESVYAGQGAALVGLEPYDEYFSLFRAHPLFLQLSVGALYLVDGVEDYAARLLVALLFGLGSVALTYVLAAEAYTRKAGLVAAAFIATMPYHVIVSRQVLVDVPMAFFSLLSLWLIAIAVRRGSQALILLGVVAAGLAALSKEVAVLLPVVVAVYLTTARLWSQVHFRTALAGAGLYTLIVLPFPVSRLLGPSGNSTGFALWQFNREPNHAADYFARILGQCVGVPLLVLAALGLVVMIRRRSSNDLLILSWLAVFFIFFQFWPTKLFFYLVVVVPGVAIAASLGLEWVFDVMRRVIRPSRRLIPEAAYVAAVVLAFSGFGAVFAWQTTNTAAAQPTGIRDFDIEVQSFAGGREFGQWAAEHTPSNSRFVTMGPSLGNILRFYGHRDSVALSVSPDPLKRNPAYVPVPNPDLAIREMAVHYLVWDAYTADRSVFYSHRLLRYADSFSATPVFSVFVADNETVVTHGPAPEGVDVRVVVYDVPGGNPSPFREDG